MYIIPLICSMLQWMVPEVKLKLFDSRACFTLKTNQKTIWLQKEMCPCLPWLYHKQLDLKEATKFT